MSEKKIRNLIDADGKSISFNDVLNTMKDCHEPLLDLEYGNKKTDLKKCKLHFRTALDHFLTFKKRIDNEVTEEVNFLAKKKNANYTGDINRIHKTNNQ